MSDGQFRKLLETTSKVSVNEFGGDSMYDEGDPLTARKLRQMLFDVQEQDAPLELMTPEGDSFAVTDIVADKGSVQVRLASASGTREPGFEEEELEGPEHEEMETPEEEREEHTM